MTTTAADTIRQYVDQSDYTHADIAAVLGVTEGAVGHWAKGRYRPRNEMAVRLDRLLGAKGEILKALDFFVVDSPLPDEISRLPAEIAELRRDVAELRERLTELATAVERELLDDEVDEPPSDATGAATESS